MHWALLFWASLVVGDVHDYARPLDAKKIDQPTLDAETYGEKKLIKREGDGLRITVAPGNDETGWKTPQALKIGGDFTITAGFIVHKLPKPAQDDGVAVGMSIATQNLDQPEATLVRLTETTDATVYRSIDKPANNPQQMMMMQFPGAGMQRGGKPPKPPRKTFRASGDSFRLELRREGSIVRYHVLDRESSSARYIGQVEFGTNDVAGVKLFASNRNGAEPLDVVLVNMTIRADRITGLGTEVRTVFGEVIHGEPTAIEDGKLIIGGPPKTPTPAPMADLPANVFAIAAAIKPAGTPPLAVAKPDPTKPANATAVKAPEPAVATAKGPEAKAGATDATAKAAAPAKVEPKARVPLGEIEEIAFERALNLAGRVVGQPNLDFTMPGAGDSKDGAPGAKPVAKADDVLAPPPGTVAAKKIPKLEPKPNGICDLYVTLSNLRNVAVKQVTINAQTAKGPTAWRLDTSDSNDWPLLLRRAGTESWADLFLEPPAGDLNGKDLTVNVMYADGQNGNVAIKVDKKIDPKLAFDPKAPAPSLDARIYLIGDEQLFGRIEA